MDSCRAWHETPLQGAGDSDPAISLARLHKGARGVVTGTGSVGPAEAIGDVAASSIERRLIELGFVPGERVEVIGELPGGDPIAVRIGSSIFALRRREAQAVMVKLEQPSTALSR
jgi:ferrous iron transport protein A